MATVAGVVGGIYLAGRYILERLEEVREQVVQETTAREKSVGTVITVDLDSYPVDNHSQ